MLLLMCLVMTYMMVISYDKKNRMACVVVECDIHTK